MQVAVVVRAAARSVAQVAAAARLVVRVAAAARVVVGLFARIGRELIERSCSGVVVVAQFGFDLRSLLVEAEGVAVVVVAAELFLAGARRSD